MKLASVKNPMLLGGLTVAACVGACAVTAVPSVLAGTGLFAIGAAAANEIAIAALAIPVLGIAYFLYSRRTSAVAGQTADACAGRSCSSVPTSTMQGGDANAPIACTLDASGARERIAAVKDLADRALRDVRRNDLTLELTYAPAAEAEVRELVRREQECCGFLDFDLRHDTEGVYVRITAPESARLAAVEMFAHFASTTA